MRDRYGRNLFGQGCLLARRLVERGVPFVEVSLGGWDTHQDNFERVKGLSQTLDTAFAAVAQRSARPRPARLDAGGLPGRVRPHAQDQCATGRDHWPASWATALAGGGIRGGQVIGRTSADGVTIEDRPVTVPDLIATVCRAVGIDPRKQNISNVTRPIRIADPDAEAIEEIL